MQSLSNITCAADIFSLGITILELATDLDLPRSGDPWHQLRNGQIPAHLVSSLSPSLVEIIMRMIEPDHTKRASAELLLRSNRRIRQIRFKKRQSFLILRFFTYAQKICILLVYGVALLLYIAVCPWQRLKQLFKGPFGKKVESGNNLNESNSLEDKRQTSTPKKNLLEFFPLIMADGNDYTDDSKSNLKFLKVKEIHKKATLTQDIFKKIKNL